MDLRVSGLRLTVGGDQVRCRSGRAGDAVTTFAIISAWRSDSCVGDASALLTTKARADAPGLPLLLSGTRFGEHPAVDQGPTGPRAPRVGELDDVAEVLPPSSPQGPPASRPTPWPGHLGGSDRSLPRRARRNLDLSSRPSGTTPSSLRDLYSGGCAM